MKDKLQQIREKAIAEIEGSDGLERLNEVRQAVLGKKEMCIRDSFYIIAAVIEFAVCRLGNPVYDPGRTYIRNLGQSDEHTFTVYVSQPAFYVVFAI